MVLLAARVFRSARTLFFWSLMESEVKSYLAKQLNAPVTGRLGSMYPRRVTPSFLVTLCIALSSERRAARVDGGDNFP